MYMKSFSGALNNYKQNLDPWLGNRIINLGLIAGTLAFNIAQHSGIEFKNKVLASVASSINFVASFTFMAQVVGPLSKKITEYSPYAYIQTTQGPEFNKEQSGRLKVAVSKFAVDLLIASVNTLSHAVFELGKHHEPSKSIVLQENFGSAKVACENDSLQTKVQLIHQHHASDAKKDIFPRLAKDFSKALIKNPVSIICRLYTSPVNYGTSVANIFCFQVSDAAYNLYKYSSHQQLEKLGVDSFFSIVKSFVKVGQQYSERSIAEYTGRFTSYYFGNMFKRFVEDSIKFYSAVISDSSAKTNEHAKQREDVIETPREPIKNDEKFDSALLSCPSLVDMCPIANDSYHKDQEQRSELKKDIQSVLLNCEDQLSECDDVKAYLLNLFVNPKAEFVATHCLASNYGSGYFFGPETSKAFEDLSWEIISPVD